MAALGIWLEYFLNSHPDAEYMMTSTVPAGKTTKEHKKFMVAIKKTYRNQWERWVLRSDKFKSIYKGKDKRPLGTHSKRKTGSTQAKRRGAGGDQVDHRGRWVTKKKGSRIVNQVYIDLEDVYANAFVASVLAIGGAVKYKPKASVAAAITPQWLADNVVPNTGKRFADDAGLVKNFGLAPLWLAHDTDAAKELDLPAVCQN